MIAVFFTLANVKTQKSGKGLQGEEDLFIMMQPFMVFVRLVTANTLALTVVIMIIKNRISNILLCSLAIAFFSNCAGSKKVAQADFKKWSKNDLLTWADFKGEPGKDSKAAYTQTGILYKVDSSQRYAYAYFYKPSSWHRSTDLKLLRHEQYHFNLEEVGVRLVRKEIVERNIFRPSPELHMLVYNISSKIRQMQIAYDAETSYGANYQKQLDWEKSIDDQLLELEKYSDLHL